MEELADATLRLQRYAERFEQAEHAQLAGAIDRTLDVVEANRGRLSSESISELNQLMQRLSRTACGMATSSSTPSCRHCANRSTWH